MNLALARGLVAAGLLALPFLPLRGPVAFAQSAVPPPPTEPVVSLAPGTEVVEPSVPAVAPENVPAITGNGTLAVVPAAPEGNVALVNADLGGGFQATAVVPADPTTPLAVSVSAIDPATVPASVPSPAVVISVEVYDAATGAGMPVPVTVGVMPPPGVDPASLSVVQYDPATGTYEVLETTVDPQTGALVAHVS